MTDLNLLQDLISAARKAGADQADAVLVGGASLSIERRLGQTEHVERSESRELGLRVFVGEKIASVSATTVDPGRFAELAERAVAMARVVPDDPFAMLAEGVSPPDAAWLDLVDPTEPEAAELVARAHAAEEAARSVAGITNSEGASASYGRVEMALVTSRGFAGRAARTSHSVSAVVLAGTGTGMQRDYDYHSAVHMADLDDPVAIGLSAGERAVARLNPGRPKTGTVSVVFDPRVAGGLLGHFLGAINGASVARGTSFLKDRMGQAVFGPGVRILDDPHAIRGLRSRAFDAEGLATVPLALVEDGVLRSWLLDLRSARQLGLASTGHAGRGTNGPPSPGATNVHLSPGVLTPAELMADIKEGLYVTELVGMGVNGLTGDYSRGAAGFMIRDGVRAEPVAEITIAGNLKDMFARMVPADDLVFRRGTDAPTVRINGMMMAGA